MRSTPVIFIVGMIALASMLGGCVTAYRMEIAQGNIVTQEMVDQLRPGMTRNQVRFILGTPLIADPFHVDRWDYYYSLRKSADKNPQIRLLTVIFRNDTMTGIEGDVSVKAEDKKL